MTDLTTPEAVAELRHELRTPLNLIIGYSEMLLEDATDAGQRTQLEAVLRGGRDVLDRVNKSLATSCNAISAAELDALFEGLREPQGRIVAAATTLLGQQPDPQLERDLRRIRSAAERLLTVELPHLAGPTSAAASLADTGTTRSLPIVAEQHPARILVVDDQEDNRAVLERRLRRQGHTVESANGGRIALARLGQERFDLVLLDVLMPDLDGYAVLEQLKGSPATRDIPVIMISALDDIRSVVRCIEAGAEDHLSKPFDPTLLRARISACLEKKRLRDGELEYLREVGHVIEAATAVESGAYDPATLAPVARRADALGRLARVFNTMANQVRAREERLKSQIDALRLEISQAQPAAPAIATGTPELPTGHVISGRYEILAELGRGGMGLVYRALDRELGEQVAVKTLHSGLVQDESMLERFKSEIRLARQISNKHVVRTHDLGEWQGIYYLTMEYVQGISMRELMDTRIRLGAEATLAIASQLAQSLVAAHEQGIIHRDIKPQNMLLDSAGVLKVMDFGVARLAERPSGLTETGMIVGTPTYMAPEQILGEAVDQRSDLYAAGVVMYECLTGRVPFDAPSLVALIAKVLREDPVPPGDLAPDTPPALSALVLRLLAKDPADRPASASELLALLGSLG